MTLGTFFRMHRGRRTDSGKRGRALVARAAAAGVCENLEARRLLSTFTHTVTAGHPIIYLTAGELSGQLDVRRDSENGPIDHQFLNRTGLDVIQAPPGATITFVDRVRAALKPTVDPNATGDPFGILVRGGNNGTLKIDATGYNNDRLIEVTESTALTATVRVTDESVVPHIVNYSRRGIEPRGLLIRLGIRRQCPPRAIHRTRVPVEQSGTRSVSV